MITDEKLINMLAYLFIIYLTYTFNLLYEFVQLNLYILNFFIK